MRKVCNEILRKISHATFAKSFRNAQRIAKQNAQRSRAASGAHKHRKNHLCGVFCKSDAARATARRVLRKIRVKIARNFLQEIHGKTFIKSVENARRRREWVKNITKFLEHICSARKFFRKRRASILRKVCNEILRKISHATFAKSFRNAQKIAKQNSQLPRASFRARKHRKNHLRDVFC